MLSSALDILLFPEKCRVQTETIEKTIAINVGKEFKYTNIVFEPYQSIMLKIAKNGSIKPIDITFKPKSPVVKKDSNIQSQ